MTKPPETTASQQNLFIATLTDLSKRDQHETIEVPFFSLSKTPRTEPLVYQSKNCFVEIIPTVKFGMATIWDADILIWAASQINAAQQRGLTPSRHLKFHPYDLLTAIKRHTGKTEYDLLRDALSRLQATTVRTSIRAKSAKRLAQFSWLDSWNEVVTDEGLSTGITITLSDWFYEGVLNQKLILAMPSTYFDITGGTERWLYRLCRKHAGKQAAGWSCTFPTLHAKSGSTQKPSDFSRDLRKIIANDKLPEYHLELHTGERGEKLLYAIRRDRLPTGHPAAEFLPTKARHLPAS